MRDFMFFKDFLQVLILVFISSVSSKPLKTKQKELNPRISVDFCSFVS